MVGSYIHDIDPVIGTILGVHLWWYGLSYSLGFLNAHLFIRRRRAQLGFSMRSVYDLSLLLATGVLLGGRFVEVAFYEWPFYREHLHLIPAFWLGGMATHGLLLGGLSGVWLFCRLHGKSFLSVADALAIPAAFILGIGRLGNFIDGQIVGSVTSIWWAVKFPDAEGFRHPVVLYDGIKNLLLIPVLVHARRRQLPSGTLIGLFLFLYAMLRIFIDVFREYPTTLLGLATGQSLNIFMSVLGLALLLVRFLGGDGRSETTTVRGADLVEDSPAPRGIRRRRFLLAFLILFSLVMPSDSTQDVPTRYGTRHPCLEYSAFYPRIDALREGAPGSKGQSKEMPSQPWPPTR